MTPQRRIKRIRRWLAAARDSDSCTCAESVHPTPKRLTIDALAMYVRLDRLHRADFLYEAELSWLCEYAEHLTDATIRDAQRESLRPHWATYSRQL